MTVGLLLLPAIGGYWLLSRWHLTKYRAERDSGYHLLLRSAGVGIILLLLAHGVAFSVSYYYPGVFFLWDVHVPQPLTSTVVISLAVGFVSPFILNQFSNAHDCARVAAERFGDHVELFLDDAMQHQKLIEVDLESRKVYIGFAINSGLGKVSETDAIILPTASGHRDEKTLALALDVDYAPIINRFLPSEENGQMIGQRGLMDFAVVVPLREIVSTRVFDHEIYNISHGITTEQQPEDTPQHEEAWSQEEQSEGRRKRLARVMLGDGDWVTIIMAATIAVALVSLLVVLVGLLEQCDLTSWSEFRRCWSSEHNAD